MRFLSKPSAVLDEPDVELEEHEPAELDLSALPWQDLAAELGRRGWQVIPAGAWEETFAKLEATIAELEAKAADAEAKGAEARATVARSVDAGPMIAKLRHLAGVVLPKTAEQACDLLKENSELRDALRVCQRDCETLIDALLRDEFPGIFGGGDG